ncbi:MAG: N-terminal phage integrase SAM-like domain-containing protein [Thermacetogeniaceae bacterium]
MGKHGRGHGEGTIYKRSDGRWCAQATVHDPATGRPKRVTFYGRTRQEVQEKLTKALYELQTGVFIEPSKVTLGEWLDIWLNNYKKLKVRKTTFGNYETMIRTYIKPALGNIPLKQIQPSTLQGL